MEGKGDPGLPGRCPSYLYGDEGLLVINVDEHVFPRTEQAHIVCRGGSHPGLRGALSKDSPLTSPRAQPRDRDKTLQSLHISQSVPLSSSLPISPCLISISPILLRMLYLPLLSSSPHISLLPPRIIVSLPSVSLPRAHFEPLPLSSHGYQLPTPGAPPTQS